MAGDAQLTPMMQQYRKAKEGLAPGTLLLYRLGDFYEMFFEDAAEGSKRLDLTLTQRAGIPMCGIPYHALNGYLQRLLDQGMKVAIAEQLEDPKLAKGLVKREVTQIITPGTIVDGDFLTAGRGNYLVSLAPGRKGDFGIACLDFSTGTFRLTQAADRQQLEHELHRLQPAECLLPATLAGEWEGEGKPEAPTRTAWTPLEDWIFDERTTSELLLHHFNVAALDGFGCRDFPLGVRAAGAVLHYAQHNLRRDAAHVTTLTTYALDQALLLDRVTQRNLELVDSLFTDAKNATLLAVLDETVTPMGSRLLREWLLRPLIDIDRIRVRQDALAALLLDPLLLLELREALASVRDLERTITRLTFGTANGRDLLVLQHSLEAMPGLKAILSHAPGSSLVQVLAEALKDLPELTALIGQAIVSEPPLSVKDGGVIRDGYHADLDELRSAATQGKHWVAELQAREQQRTGIKSLKVRYNRVFGYYIEVSKSNLPQVPADYHRKQTIANGERFVTGELKEIEDKILNAEEKSKALETELFHAVRGTAVAQTAVIQASARAVAELDVLASLAEVARTHHYCRPEVNAGMVIDIRDGRHPVLDHLMREQPFVPNDLQLDADAQRLLIITGPNMAGKSTYIRQAALLVIMAQLGSYLPAASAVVGLVDRVFTRVGAADDLSRGQSTFMVEMLETANILRNATPRSLVVLDEIGRGTSTFDGLSLAWAVAEYLHNTPTVAARALFATHYHELTELALTLPAVKNYNVAVREYGDQIVFLHKILPGAADRSYGIHVARLAGLPVPVLDRAKEVLANLEGDALDPSLRPKLARSRKASGGTGTSTSTRLTPPPAQLSLFDALGS